MQFARLANTLLNDEVSAQNNDFLSCKLTLSNIYRFKKIHSQTQQ